MPLYISSLNSGSNGNCYYIGNQDDAVFVDAGISCRETERRMARSGLDMNKIRAVFISHEHSDHIRGAEFISRKFKVPIYISQGTYAGCRFNIDPKLLRHFDPYQVVSIGDLNITAFPKQHDASDPHSFTITGNGITVGVLTDIGTPCQHVISNFRLCHAAFLEANYDEEMLEKGRYPVYLKRRIRSDHGHLSNYQSLALFTDHRPDFMSHLLLSHLSQDNNNPSLVENLFRRHAGNVHIIIASRHHESKVYCITGDTAGIHENTIEEISLKQVQLRLF